MKHLRYLRYLIRHKWFVLLAGLRTGVPLWRLLIHDWSKFLPAEWFPYVEFFYGQQADKNEPDDFRYWGAVTKLRDPFDRAWLHHQHFNPHHWQYWILREDGGDTKYVSMPEHFAREMVADWCGAGRAITGRWEVWIWYAKNCHNILLNSNTVKLVEKLVDAEYQRMTAKHDESLSDA